MLPHFIGIGAQKSGTSWLHVQLEQHPQVFLPPEKELDFFFRDLPREWYESRFAGAPAERLRGEISPNYLPRPIVVERMHALVPDARLIAILRNPADRAFSQWKMARQLGNLPMDVPFLQAFRDDQRLLRTQGLYLQLLAKFEKYFPLDSRLLVLFYDDIAADPMTLMRAVHRFLGIDDSFVSPLLGSVIGGATDAASADEADWREVAGWYESENRRLGERFGRDLGHWAERGMPCG
jgi:hypothetical protein